VGKRHESSPLVHNYGRSDAFIFDAQLRRAIVSRKRMEKFSLGSLRAEVEKMIRAGSVVAGARTRAQFLLSWDAGEGMSAIAEVCNVARTTVFVWQRRYKSLADESPFSAVPRFIKDVYKPGRPARRALQIRAALDKLPPSEMTGSVRLARRLKVPERTVRRFLASHRRKARK
jgi:hypothetical protein